MEPWTPEWKQEALDELRQEWDACDRCGLCQKRNSVVFGSGSPTADILFVGEGPGEEEDNKGEPFVGASGTVFDYMMDSIGFSRKDAFITNLVGCRPPENRQPLRTEKEACWERVATTIYIIDPMIVVTVGAEALQFLVGGRALALEKCHGKLLDESVKIPSPPCHVFPRTDEKKNVWYVAYDAIPIYHPAAVLRNDSYSDNKKEFQRGGLALKTQADMKYVVDRVTRLKTAYEKSYKFFRR
jgi:DNA polymerase